MKTKIKKRRIPEATGFTLIEVMVSIALTLILLLGINFIFSTSAGAVRAGEALASVTREQRGAQTQIFNDLNNVAKDAPFLISMRQMTQWLSADDAQTSATPEQISIDNNGGFATVNPAIYGRRSHRVDILQFCAHQFQERRTSDNNSFYSYTFSNDVWEQIGHGNLPSTDLSNWYGPDDVNAPSTNPPSILGAYAADWILNRTVILFKAPSNVPMDYITSIQAHAYVPTPEIYYCQDPTETVVLAGQSFSPYLSNLTPFSWGTFSTDKLNQFGDSRYDMAGMTLEEFKQVCVAYVLNQTNSINTSMVNNVPIAVGNRFPLWCAAWMYHQAPVTSKTSSQIWDPIVTAVGAAAVGNTPALPPVWDWLHAASNDSRHPLMNRFNINPTIQTQQTSASIAEMMPYLIQHCSQFIVEYAGDYMSQNTDGTITGIASDGTTDFYVDSLGQHHVRWYGLPRKTTQNPATGIRGFDPTSDTNTTMIANSYQDVIPLSDYITLFYGVGAIPTNNKGPFPLTNRITAPFEVECNFSPCRDYTGISTGTTTFVGNDSSNSNDSRYAVAWYNNTPTMIRILIKVDDPNDALKNGPWFEYIYHLK